MTFPRIDASIKKRSYFVTLMDNQAVTELVKSSLAAGQPMEEIYRRLLAQSATIDQIQAGFATLTAEHEKADTQKKTVRIILSAGAILIGAGVFSLVASNWADMTKDLKVSIILLSMVASYAAGWQMEERYGFQKTGEALTLLGAIIYGAGIFLVGQIFNIHRNWPDGFILWMLGALALGFALDLYPLFYLAVIVGFIAAASQPWVLFGTVIYSSTIFTSSLLLAAATAVVLFVSYFMRRRMPDNLKEYY